MRVKTTSYTNLVTAKNMCWMKYIPSLSKKLTDESVFITFYRQWYVLHIQNEAILKSTKTKVYQALQKIEPVEIK